MPVRIRPESKLEAVSLALRTVRLSLNVQTISTFQR